MYLNSSKINVAPEISLKPPANFSPPRSRSVFDRSKVTIQTGPSSVLVEGSKAHLTTKGTLADKARELERFRKNKTP
jgi:hypothetical protein